MLFYCSGTIKHAGRAVLLDFYICKRAMAKCSASQPGKGDFSICRGDLTKQKKEVITTLQKSTWTVTWAVAKEKTYDWFADRFWVFCRIKWRKSKLNYAMPVSFFAVHLVFWINNLGLGRIQATNYVMMFFALYSGFRRNVVILSGESKKILILVILSKLNLLGRQFVNRLQEFTGLKWLRTTVKVHTNFWGVRFLVTWFRFSLD